MVNKLVVEDFIDAWTLGGIVVEDFGNEIACGIGDRYIVGERIGIHADALVSGLNITGLEGRLADDESINYYSQ